MSALGRGVRGNRYSAAWLDGRTAEQDALVGTKLQLRLAELEDATADPDDADAVALLVKLVERAVDDGEPSLALAWVTVLRDPRQRRLIAEALR